ncbi:protein phosphatase [Encephalitozoon hellem]|uniref:Type 1 phosphatases regulator n=1 Tax=Encephalitozoon hellem TaxID=27973 RepID=A0A9Q9C2V5_ENCHE|nr:protein phosphatase inhibitor [Encephalitozoon hellem ATCC 50504]AHL28927.1 protein phosphatase inhibitor [Encephalitozoon hellem ATCC 50504]KAG5859628.1 protein phosphatase [Encephalitozoon hellem]UTX43109.1 protein phosphatase inhibitor [Encephalitozoon hellem]WEL38566.1 protein phosphatase inhibitor [Encephalitozoon hellem]
MSSTITMTKMKLKLVQKEPKRVTWTKDTVDNEGMGKKKSKICCIYCSKGKDKDKNKYERP